MAEHADGRTPKRVTLEDVARHAEVSRALVSIVMRNAPGASAATRERVWAAARELGYRPDVRARSLASQSSRLIGIMFGVGIGVFQFDLLEGLYDAAEDHGHSLILTPLTRGRDERRAAQSLHDFRFDGLIMLGPPTASPLLAGTVPLAVVGWHVDDPSVDVVRTSDEHGMALAVDHLVELGHRRIAHIDGGDTLISESRRTAYARAMQRHGLGAEIRVRPRRSDASSRANTRPGRCWRRTISRPRSSRTTTTSQSRRWSCSPSKESTCRESLSIIGWDDSDAAALASVALTSVAQRPG